MDYEIIHQPEQKLFKTEVDGRTAFVQYRLIGDSLDIIHTIVWIISRESPIRRYCTKAVRPSTSVLNNFCSG